MIRVIAGLTIVLLAIGVIAAACGENEKYENASPAATTAAQATAPAQASAAAGAVNVAQLDFRFQPDKLTAQVGRSVTVDVTNNGKASHTFTITELNVDKTLAPGEKASVTFTPTGSGTLAYFCRFHRSRGMEGSLSVSGAAGGASPGGVTPTTGGGGGGYGY